MTGRLSLVDLDIHLALMQYGEQPDLESLHELLFAEFPEDKITFEEVCEWNSMALEISDLEESFNICYEEYNY